MSKDSFTPEKIRSIVEQAREINGSEEKELFISRACNANGVCVEAVKKELSLLSKESPIYVQTTEDFADKLSTVILSIKDSEFLIGKEIGGYTLKEKFKEGGMSNVFRADKYIDEKYENFAIKLINKEFAKRFFRKEWEKLKYTPQHQNLAKFIESGFDEKSGHYYFVLEYIDGLPITKYCEDKYISLKKRLELFLDVCEAVKFLHKTPKFTHNDIKPSNILVKFHPENPYLIDFGIAKFTQNIPRKVFDNTQEIVCSPFYASPELISNEPVSEVSDIYSLGVVLYELLTGYNPYEFQEIEPESWKKTVCEQIPELPSQIIYKKNVKELSRHRKCTHEEFKLFLAGEIDQIILKCLEKTPESRYETVEHLIIDLKAFLNNWSKKKEGLIKGRRQAEISSGEISDLQIIPQKILIPSAILGGLICILTIIIHFSLSNLVKNNAISSTPPNQNAKDFPEWYLAQSLLSLCFITFLVIIILTSLKDKLFDNIIIRDSFHQFLKGLFAVSTTWFILYSYYYIVLFYGVNEDNNAVFQTTVDVLNALTSVSFFYLFLVMDMPSVSSEANSKRNQNFRNTFILIILVGVFVAFFGGFGRFNQFFGLGEYISGLFAAISMIYFFGRLGSHSMLYFGEKLDSPYVNIKRWSLVLLYAYGIVQIIGPKFVGESATSYFILLLGFKLYLFVILIWWLLNENFLRYFNQASNYIEIMQSKNKS